MFDRIPAVKSLFHDPELPHTSSETFYGLTWQWLDHWLARERLQAALDKLNPAAGIRDEGDGRPSNRKVHTRKKRE